MASAHPRLTRRNLLTGTAAFGAAALTGARAGAAAPVPRFAAPAVLKQQKVKVRIAQFGSVEGAQAVQELFGPFQEEQPEIEVEVAPIEAPDWDGYFAKLLTQIAAGQTPDMIWIATEGTQLFASELAAPLDDLVTRDQAQMREYFADVAPALVESFMYEGSLYALPSAWNATNLFYNKERFAEAGVPLPTENWTKDEFAAAMPLLSGDGRYGFAWTNRHWGGAIPWIFVNDSNILVEERAPGGEWLWQGFYADDPAAQGRGGGFRYPASMAGDAKNAEALQFLVDLTHELKAAPSVAEADALLSQATSLFGTGQLATFLAGGFQVAGLAAAGVTPDQYDVTFMPKWKTQRHQFGSDGYVITKDAQNKEAAWEVMKYRVRQEVIKTVVSTESGLGSTPARRSLASADLYAAGTSPEHFNVFYDTLDKFPDTGPIPAPTKSVQFASIFTRYVGLAMARDESPQEALDGMHEELTELLGQPV